MKIIFSILTLLILRISFAQQIDVSRIEIIRDQWGVPHIYAPTDEEVAYGLAWATAEDDFKSMQENFLAARGKLASVKGKDGAIMDYFSALIGARQIAVNKYDTAFSPKYKRILEYYCMGVNAYAAAHPEEVLLKGVFPASPIDMIAGYVLGMTLMNNVQYSILKIFKGTINSPDLSVQRGSNALAISPKKTADGKTYLAVNSHQPLTGPYSWYEAHLVSDEGWNILGGTFPGGTTIFHGVNEHLGWAHTVNLADLHDVYELSMHPKNKIIYKYDNQWKELKKEKLRLKVKIGFIKLPVKRTIYSSVYGPTLKGKDGKFYSLRFPANMDIRAAEQWYRMNKATNFEEYYSALRMQGISGLNFVYADKAGNIFYLDNANFPKRADGYDWWNAVRGDTSATLWEAGKYYPVEALAQVKNPDCGYVFNTNNTPFVASGEDCTDSTDACITAPYYFRFNNNRSLRMQALMDAYETIGYDDFKKVKFDQKIHQPAYTYAISNLEEVLSLNPEEYPSLADVIRQLNEWDRNADTLSTGATVAVLWVQYMKKDLMSSGRIPLTETTVPRDKIIEYLTHSQKHLLKYFSSTAVPLGQLQRLVRGEKSLPVSGMPDVIAAMDGSPTKKGILQAESGESYIMMIQMGDEMEIETISPYGSSSKPESPHFDDQMQMFVSKQLKPMSLNLSEVRKNAVRIYHPGVRKQD